MKVFRWAAVSFFLFMFLLLIPVSAYANEPIVPLMILFVGSGGLALALGSLIGFAVIVVIKCAVFLWKSDFRSWLAVLYVIIANVVSTFIGIIVASMFSSSFAFPAGVIILYFLFLVPARRIRQFKRYSKHSVWFIAFVLLMITVFSVVIFGAMSGFMSVPYIYWPLKVVMMIIGIGISLIISVLYEESIIAGLYKIQKKERKSFMKPVLWANIIALGALMLLGAAIALPKRFSSPDFLILFLKSTLFVSL